MPIFLLSKELCRAVHCLTSFALQLSSLMLCKSKKGVKIVKYFRCMPLSACVDDNIVVDLL